MKNLNVILKSLSFIFLLTLTSSISAQQVDYFLKIDGVAGESTDDKHENEIDILSWSWGESHSGKDKMPNARTNRRTYEPIVIRKRIDKSSPLLANAAKYRKVIPSIDLGFVLSDGKMKTYLKIKMTDVLISSYQTGGSSGDVIPVDQISFNFTKIEFEYQDGFGRSRTVFKAEK